MNLRNLCAASLAVFLLTAAQADEGHDHGPAPSTASGPALPRFAAVSESFELVGVLDGKRLTLYLDRYADNTPVPDASIELDIGGVKATARPHEGDYEVTLAETPQPGVLPITATIAAGTEVDLLAGELDLHEAAHADEPAAGGWRERALWVMGGLVVLLVAGIAWRRLVGRGRRPSPQPSPADAGEGARQAARSVRTGGAA